MNAYQIGNLCAIVCVVIVSPFVGVWATKSARRNRLADFLGSHGYPATAEELRQTKPVMPYYVTGSLVGLLIALGINLAGTLLMFIIGVDLFAHRMSLIPYMLGCMVIGLGAAGLAGFWVLRKGS